MIVLYRYMYMYNTGCSCYDKVGRGHADGGEGQSEQV